MSKTVLVVDDEVTNRELFRQVLTLQGYDVLEAASGKQAIAEVQSSKPDLILLDLFMPEGDGLSVLHAVRGHAETKETPVVVVTAALNEAIHEKTKEAGCDALLRKPVDMQALLETIGQFISKDD
ncbi:MAG: response regulator [Candidatus Latescibacteria bacterium]|jgi:CheY-like chemotaxis protein|nr:response regulator [Candidatus Latescibacterota bacterium]MBT4137990.1 response regulator [Candidatus Latescibacterota bacterium]